MDTFHTIILALIQGITEFLPISSSAHLILPNQLLGWEDQGLAFDVAVHVGSLAAVVVYFRKELLGVAVGGLQSVVGKWSDDGRLAWLLVLATVPAAVFGLLMDDIIEAHLRTSLVIAITTLVGGGLLFVADRSGGGTKSLLDITWKAALIIGVAQAVAMIPGTSRSGITITMALFLGFSRDSSARFSFLMSVPVILLGGAWKTIELLGMPEVPWGQIVLGAVVSAISAYLCIHYFLKFIQQMGMLPFVIYRIMLGVFLLAWVA